MRGEARGRLFVWFQHVLPQHGLSRLTLVVTRVRVPWIKNLLIRGFLALFEVDMSEAAETDPYRYASFNEFFTRALETSARPIAPGAADLACPVDGRVSECGMLEGDSLLQAKGRHYSVIDLLAGRIDSQFGLLTTTKRYIQNGQLRALGVTTSRRIADLPDVPTIAESGVPGFEVTLWMAVIAPAKMPQNIVDTLSADINQALAQDDVKQALANQAIFVDPKTPVELHATIEKDLKKWTDLAGKADLIQ